MKKVIIILLLSLNSIHTIQGSAVNESKKISIYTDDLHEFFLQLFQENKKLRKLENDDTCPICLSSLQELTKDKNAVVMQTLCCGQCICKKDLLEYINNRNAQIIANVNDDTIARCLTCNSYPWLIKEFNKDLNQTVAPAMRIGVPPVTMGENGPTG